MGRLHHTFGLHARSPWYSWPCHGDPQSVPLDQGNRPAHPPQQPLNLVHQFRGPRGTDDEGIAGQEEVCRSVGCETDRADMMVEAAGR